MIESSLFNLLNYVDHSRENRQKAAQYILDNPEYITELLKIAFTENLSISHRACWVLEFLSKTEIEWLLPHVSFFVAKMHTITNNQSVRPIAKVTECLIEGYFKQNNKAIQEALQEKDLKKITETCFDWLINDEKVAVKAYSMNSLFLLGKKFNWIHHELKHILEKDFSKHSAAYQARAKHLLKKFN